jgi:N-acetyl-alpha-D-muramate 1-phosphate uridylyltransferase
VRGDAAKLAPLLKIAMTKDLVTGVKHSGVWHDIGTPERLKELDSVLKVIN